MAPAKPSRINGIIPLTAVAADGAPLGGACMTIAGAGGAKASSPCDSCHFVDETMGFLREETKKRGFPTIDGVHMGPCEIHRKHAQTIGPDGALYACPGFTGESTLRHRPHHRRPDAGPGEGGRHLRPHRRLAPVRRLLVHPRVRRRLQRRLAHRTR